MSNNVDVTIQREVNGTNNRIVAVFMAEYLELQSHRAITELMKNVASEVAAKIFEENKEKIISGVSIDLLVGEIQKILLEKIQNHGQQQET